MRIRLIFAVFALILIIPFSAKANVSLKNGNFFIGYSDILFPGGMEPKVERVYNSKSIHDGIFGYGWGSDYEVYLSISADGSVVAHENGGGAQNRFTPPVINTAEVDRAVENILAAKRKMGADLSGALMSAERTRLRNDARYRNDEWERLYNKGTVQARQIAPGAILKSNKYSYQVITKTKDGYVRNFDNGQVQTFNAYGHLVRVADKNGNYLNFTRDRTGHLVSLQDNLNRRIAFTYNNMGKVAKVVGDGGKWAVYEYAGSDLSASKDSEGNSYHYKYSANGRHNLVEVQYSDKSTLQVGYYEMNVCENVKWIKDRDGSLTDYGYTGDCVGGAGAHDVGRHQGAGRQGDLKELLRLL